MKKLIIPICILFAACNNTPTPQAEETKTAAENHATTEQNAAKASTELETYFKGGGNEPGWNVVVKAANDGTFPTDITTDYGAVTSQVVLKKEALAVDGKNNVQSGEVKLSGTIELAGKGEAVEIILNAGECSDDADVKHSHQITLILGAKTLKGCGDYAAN
jgi:uncharacterized membrane protein